MLAETAGDWPTILVWAPRNVILDDVHRVPLLELAAHLDDTDREEARAFLAQRPRGKSRWAISR